MTSTKNSIYLETSALIDALLKGWYPELEAIINSSGKITTSQYSIMEIKKGFLRYWILLYNKAVQYQSIDRIHQFISNLTRSPNRYYLGACADAITLFSKNYSSSRPKEIINQYGEANEGEIQLQMFKSFFRIHIKRCFHRIEKVSDKIYNPMECFKDIRSPREENGMFFNKPEKCDESKKKCNIKGFMKENVEAFQKILKELESLDEKDEETTRRISSLKNLLKLIRLNRDFSNNIPNNKHCWNCGDAIHAVIPNIDETVITCNLRHFEPICNAIDKSLRSYSSPKI